MAVQSAGGHGTVANLDVHQVSPPSGLAQSKIVIGRAEFAPLCFGRLQGFLQLLRRELKQLFDLIGAGQVLVILAFRLFVKDVSGNGRHHKETQHRRHDQRR